MESIWDKIDIKIKKTITPPPIEKVNTDLLKILEIININPEVANNSNINPNIFIANKPALTSVFCAETVGRIIIKLMMKKSKE